MFCIHSSVRMTVFSYIEPNVNWFQDLFVFQHGLYSYKFYMRLDFQYQTVDEIPFLHRTCHAGPVLLSFPGLYGVTSPTIEVPFNIHKMSSIIRVGFIIYNNNNII